MADKQLSQAEIDALLNSLTSGAPAAKEDEGPKIRKYDFKSPKKFTKEQLRTLDGLYENFSRMLSSFLSGILRQFCEVTVLSIEEQRFFEYNNALPDSALIGKIDLKPADKHYSDGMLLMDMSTSLGFYMIERLLGGIGTNFMLTRDYTDIELAILDNVFTKILSRLQNAWCSYVDVVFSLTSIETNARLLQALGAEEIVVIVMLNVKIAGVTGTLNICIPAENLEELIGNFNIKYSRSSKRREVGDVATRRKFLFNELLDTSLEVKAVLDESNLSLSDILQLQVDDVIPLNKNIQGDITVVVDGMPWYTGKMGETKTKKAVRLNELISESRERS